MSARVDRSQMNKSKYNSTMTVRGGQKIAEEDEGLGSKDDDYDYEMEEQKEVSSNLTLLRRKHDEAKRQVTQKEDQIQSLQHENAQLSEQALVAEGDQMVYESRLQSLNEALGQTNSKEGEEYLNKRTYMHLMERMRKDLLKIRIKSNKMENRLDYKCKLVQEQTDKARSLTEQNRISQIQLNKLMDQVEDGHLKREDHVENLKKTIRNKEDAVARRLERLKRQQEITEAAAHDNTDQSEVKTREKFLVHKFWNNFLKRKMKREMNNCKSVEEAYKRIQKETGIEDAQEIVVKFLTREQTFAQYIQDKQRAEKELEELRKENEELEAEYANTNIDSDELGSKKDMYDEIDRIDREIANTHKEKIQIEEKHSSCTITHEKVKSWADKQLLNIKHIFNEINNEIGLRTLESLPDDEPQHVFAKLAAVTVIELKKYDEEIEDEFNMQSMKFEHSEDYLSKNVRVRPVSTYNKLDESVHSQYGMGEGENKYEKDNADINMEIINKRRVLKDVERKFIEDEQIHKKRNEKKGEGGKEGGRGTRGKGSAGLL